ncbi:unnamed protein product [Acanthosepion pharaonis]|uniref:Nucleolar 27S pre-rRNA processing Urb2/Npa2 C-terminal domain-containing protein n=1 Tax=Acanthosepion pharaonis TaxID=158019 RepID=A0A812B378_ACAPH|nr:unnamed protein product [Sepia pharaonis]
MVVSSVVKGYYFRLKDKSTPLDLKLKLIKFAWNNDCIVIANKVQVLLDCIGGLLMNTKKNVLSDEEIGSIWECLDWLLLSNKVRSSKETFVLKPSFSQAVILTMNRLTTEIVPYKSSILRCCKSLFMSPALSYLFTSNIQKVVSILSVICTVSIRQLHKTGSLDQSLQELLSILTDVYNKGQRTNPNQKKVYDMFCDKLFLPCVILKFLCKSHLEYEGISCSITAIMENTLLDKDQFIHYNSYLKITCNMESSAHMPKVIEKFFNLMKNGLTGHDETAPSDKTRAAILDYLPTFFVSYLQREKDNSESCRMMFFALNKQIGITVETKSLCGPLKESDVLIVLDYLLKHAYDFGIYDVGQDNAEDGVWLLYFTMLLEFLLTVKSKTTPWYSCLETLIQLNPEITEDHLSSIFATCWQSLSQIDNSEIASVDSFLKTVFTIYHKLRKVPILIDMLIKSIEDTNNACYIQFPQQAYTKFQSIIQLLPQTVEITIWEKLVTVIKDKLTEVITSQDKDASIKCAKTMNLLVYFLHHCVVVGATVTAQTIQKMQELMIQMKETILSNSITYCIDKTTFDQVLLEATLLLTHAWGELVLLLAHFASSDIQPQFNEPLAFRCFSSSTWKKILKHLNKGTFIANLLQLQRIKAAQLFPGSLSEKEAIQVCDVDYILKPLLDPESSEVTDKTFKISQFFTHNGLSVKTRRQSSWLLITANLPLLMPLFNQDQLHAIAEIVLDTFRESTEQSEDHLETFLTEKLLKDSSFQEMRPFHSCLISVAFSKLSSLAAKQKKESGSAKKQKVSSVDISEIFTKLGNRKINWCQSQKKAAKCLKNIGEDVCSLLESFPVANKTGLYVQKNSTTYIQVLQNLPLRFLSSNDQIRVIMGLQVLLACNPLSDLVNELNDKGADCQLLNLASVQCSIACLQILFFSSGDNSVFLYLNPESFLNYLETIFTEVKQESVGACKIPLLISLHQLLEGAFFALVNEQKNFPALQSYILKLCKSLQKAHKKLSKKPQKTETFNKKYSLTYLLARILVEVLGKKIHACIWKKNVKKEVVGFLDQLSKDILNTSNCFSDVLPSSLIAAYNSVLTYQDSLPDLDKETVDKLWKNMSVCCYENLHKKDVSLLLLSVQFYFISLNQNHTAQHLKTDELNFYSKKMISDLTAETALTDTIRLKSTVEVFLALFAGQRMKDEHLPRFINSQSDILRCSQTIFQQIQWHTDLSKVENVAIPLLHLEAKILQKYKNTLPSQVAVQVMLGCQYVRLNELPVSTFCAVFHALCDVLFSLLLDFNRAVLATLPSFIGVLKRLLVSVCQEGSQDILAKKSEAVQPISDCAQYLTRLILLLSNYKIELSKLVSHLIADYLAATQQTTLWPSIKNFLDNGLNILLGICNQHAIQNLMTELPDGLKHVFRSVYNKYVQNHKYTGNI